MKPYFLQNCKIHMTSFFLKIHSISTSCEKFLYKLVSPLFPPKIHSISTSCSPDGTHASPILSKIPHLTPSIFSYEFVKFHVTSFFSKIQRFQLHLIRGILYVLHILDLCDILQTIHTYIDLLIRSNDRVIHVLVNARTPWAIDFYAALYEEEGASIVGEDFHR